MMRLKTLHVQIVIIQWPSLGHADLSRVVPWDPLYNGLFHAVAQGNTTKMAACMKGFTFTV